MRSRNIKPGLFKNELLGVADPILTLLFAGLWCMADREGRMENRPLRIKAEIFPYRSLDVNGYLTELTRLGFIQQYEVDGNAYIQIAKFHEHQHPHHTEARSKIPAITDGCDLTVNSPLNTGGTPSDSLIPDSLIPDSVVAAATSPKQISFSTTEKFQRTFDWFWREYTSSEEGCRGRKGDKQKTLDRMRKTITSEDDALRFGVAVNEYLDQVDSENEGRPIDRQRALKLPEVFVNSWKGYMPDDVEQRVADHKARQGEQSNG